MRIHFLLKLNYIRSYDARIGTGTLKATPVSQIRMKVNNSLIQDPGALLEPCFVNGQPYDRNNISRVPDITGRNYSTVWTRQGALQAPAECVYRMSFKISQALSQYFRLDFFREQPCWWDSQNYSNNLSWVSCTSEAWWLDSLYNRGFATFESVDSLAEHIPCGKQPDASARQQCQLNSTRVRVRGNVEFNCLYASRMGLDCGSCCSGTDDARSSSDGYHYELAGPRKAAYLEAFNPAACVPRDQGR